MAPPGRGALLLSADYSQIELRVLAHFSGDPGLRALFVRGPRGEEPPADAFAAIAARMAMGVSATWPYHRTLYKSLCRS